MADTAGIAYSLGILDSLMSQADSVRGVASNGLGIIESLGRGNDELIEQVGSALREIEGKAWEMMDIIRCTKNTMNMLAGRRAEE